MPDNDIIYFDHAAATPISKSVVSSMLPYFSEKFFNPSSPYALAVKVRREYQEAKSRIAQSIGAKPDELTMTAGATESINLAFQAVGGHIVTSEIEHAAVLVAAKTHDHTLVPVTEQGVVRVEAVVKAIRPDTEIVSIALVNSELGTVQPLKAIAAKIKEIRAKRLEEGNHTPLYLHSDASQGACVLDVHVSRIGVDLLTLNAGKIYGPKQTGLLWASSKVHLKPVVVGGGQENGLRSGTENVPSVIGFAKAMELTVKKRDGEFKRLGELSEILRNRLISAFPDAVFSGANKHQLPGFVHISFPEIDAERLVYALEARGVLVATGSACAANKNTRSHVLEAIGLSDDLINGSLRLSLGKLSDHENVEKGVNIIIEEVNREYDRSRR